ncbi:MAG: type III pantothenate kinase [Ignavibacteriaceae bacterium]|jgi:type III pantothenate kinase|nr:type III pantothenate kinase [Ignavibacteriaceae bacterium]MCW8813308.1 type III pantothenate kinase [Chlorobium sp.]MCW9094593.1 type III pantothenate kinase [Ignavibacteriaceae bacterium]
MLLTLDIGNTNIKSALFNDDELNEFKIHSDIESTINYLKSKTFSEAAFCSVSPKKEKILIDEISIRKISIFRANIHSKLNLKIKYKTPDTLGIDRICSAVGAYDFVMKENIELKDQYILTIDFGTATTINAVSPKGYFVGGLIAPGIKTMLKSLNEKTAQLPIPELNSYAGLIGNSTNSSILSGVFTATIGMINETVNRLKEMSKGTEPIIFVTGGNAEFILTYIKHNITYEEVLVLKGLKVIYELNK